jgi:DNA-binding NtrC family response regulator
VQWSRFPYGDRTPRKGVDRRRTSPTRWRRDEPNALAELISGWGYRTETARDGLEAWEKAQAWDPAIVVTDLKMPRMDGMGLLAKLAEGAEGLSANMAVVVLTAMGSIQLAVDAMKLGAYDFLQKPVDATRLKTILANAARQRQTAIELEVARRRLRESGVLGHWWAARGRCVRFSR